MHNTARAHLLLFDSRAASFFLQALASVTGLYMCDYLFTARHRRAIAVDHAVRTPLHRRPPAAEFAFSCRVCARAAVRLLASATTRVAEGYSERTIDVCGHQIIIYELVAEHKSVVTGISTRLWRCSLGMSWWLAEQAQIFDGKRVLEVGTGTGLCALALAASSTAHVTATDLDEHALDLVRAAARTQALDLTVRALDLAARCVHDDHTLP